jgi:hypothetical protein
MQRILQGSTQVSARRRVILAAFDLSLAGALRLAVFDINPAALERHRNGPGAVNKCAAE